MARNNNYGSIESMEQLNNALQSLEENSRVRLDKLASDYRHVKTFYTPANLFNMVVDKVSPVFNLLGMAIDSYDRFRIKLQSYRAKRKGEIAEKAAKVAAEETSAQAVMEDEDIVPLENMEEDQD